MLFLITKLLEDLDMNKESAILSIFKLLKLFAQFHNDILKDFFSAVIEKYKVFIYYYYYIEIFFNHFG